MPDVRDCNFGGFFFSPVVVHWVLLPSIAHYHYYQGNTCACRKSVHTIAADSWSSKLRAPRSDVRATDLSFPAEPVSMVFALFCAFWLSQVFLWSCGYFFSMLIWRGLGQRNNTLWRQFGCWVLLVVEWVGWATLGVSSSSAQRIMNWSSWISNAWPHNVIWFEIFCDG